MSEPETLPDALLAGGWGCITEFDPAAPLPYTVTFFRARIERAGHGATETEARERAAFAPERIWTRSLHP